MQVHQGTLEIPIRELRLQDVSIACDLLNEIVRIGGTTAQEQPLDDATFALYYAGDDLIACHVAIDPSGQVAGFQWIGVNAALDKSCADIATFTRRTDPVRGAGRALFEATRKFAKRAAYAQINATIRADNLPGLGYYAKMGFVDHAIKPAVPLRDGTPVDRISKRFTL